MRDDEYESTFGASMLEHEDAEPRNPTENPTMGELISQRFSRRGLLKGALAVSAISATVGTLALETAAPPGASATGRPPHDRPAGAQWEATTDWPSASVR